MENSNKMKEVRSIEKRLFNMQRRNIKRHKKTKRELYSLKTTKTLQEKYNPRKYTHTTVVKKEEGERRIA